MALRSNAVLSVSRAHPLARQLCIKLSPDSLALSMVEAVLAARVGEDVNIGARLKPERQTRGGASLVSST